MKSNINTIPTSKSSSDEWIEWHKSLKSRFGRKKANKLFIHAWEKRAGAGSDASTVSLREYMEKQGLQIDTSAWEDITDFGSGVADFIGSGFTMMKWAGIVTGVIILGGVAMILYNVAKDPAKSVGTAANVALKGRGGV